MDTLAFATSPLVLAVMLVWNFAVLSAVQLTVRLIGAYSPTSTAFAALLLTVAGVPVGMALLGLTQFTFDPTVAAELRARGLALFQAYAFQQRLTWFPAAIVLTAGVGFVIIRKTLRFKRTRSAVAAAVGIGLLSAPWVVFLKLPG